MGELGNTMVVKQPDGSVMPAKQCMLITQFQEAHQGLWPDEALAALTEGWVACEHCRRPWYLVTTMPAAAVALPVVALGHLPVPTLPEEPLA